MTPVVERVVCAQNPFVARSCTTAGSGSGSGGTRRLLPLAFALAFDLPEAPACTVSTDMPEGVRSRSLYLNPLVPMTSQHAPPAHVPPAGTSTSNRSADDALEVMSMPHRVYPVELRGFPRSGIETASPFCHVHAS